jgi:hypothetical protein
MKRTSILAVAVAGLVLVGCTVTEPIEAPAQSTQPSRAVTASTASTVTSQTCPDPSVTVTAVGTPTAEIVAALRRDANVRLLTVWDKPIESTLTWESDVPWLTDDNVRQQLVNSASISQSVGIPEVERFLEGVEDDGSIVGYAAQDVQESTVQIVCSNGQAAQGRLVNWVIVEIGVVVCGNSPITPSAGSVAESAKVRFCASSSGTACTYQ